MRVSRRGETSDIGEKNSDERIQKCHEHGQATNARAFARQKVCYVIEVESKEMT